MGGTTPVTESAHLTFPPGTTFEDPSTAAGGIWQDSLATLRRQDGYQRSYWGRKVESPNDTDWDSLDAHEKFMAAAEYGPFVKNLVSMLEAPPALHHTAFSPWPATRALSNTSSPVTELVTFHFPASFADDDNDDDVSSFDATFAEFAKIVDEADGFRARASGWVVEQLEHDKAGKGKAFDLAFGWDSVDAHLQFRETKAFQDSIGPIRGKVAGVQSCHVSFAEV
ncbi:MAG: hypothetical protein M1837_003513 [Sclerophora amabilis]|nr:MAG: hypothetical protein M1837_003513 [Sclerophora amabilis]